MRNMKIFINKIKDILFGYKATFIYCPKCKSKNVAFGEIILVQQEMGMTETYPVMCNTCEAQGYITETWL